MYYTKLVRETYLIKPDEETVNVVSRVVGVQCLLMPLDLLRDEHFKLPHIVEDCVMLAR